MGKPAEDVSGDFLQVQDQELRFTFELRKQVSTNMHLTNKTSQYVAFKVKTTAPKKYCVRPNAGLIPPQSAADVVVTMQAQKEAPEDLICKDKFLVQSTIASQGSSTDLSSSELFAAPNEVREVKLKVAYVAPEVPASAGAVSTGTAPAGTAAQATSVAQVAGISGTDSAAKEVWDLRAKLTAAKQTLAQVTEERNAAIREAQSLQSQKQQLQAGGSSGWSTTLLLLVALFFLLVGYLTGPRFLSPVEQEL